MARVTLKLPEQFSFSTEIDVRIYDINMANHVGYDSMISLIAEARVRFLAHHGYKESDIDGCGILMADMVVIYRSEAFYGDILTVDIALGDFTQHGCDFIYRVTSKKTGREVVRAKNGFVFFDFANKEILKVPEKFRALFTETVT